MDDAWITRLLRRARVTHPSPTGAQVATRFARTAQPLAAWLAVRGLRFGSESRYSRTPPRIASFGDVTRTALFTPP